jgi:sigma-B regulation protein RsbU (phosphoserine phosphatase)
MLLRTRVTLIVSITYSLLVVGLTFAGIKSEELADERYAQATLNGQETFWRKLVENTVQRLEAAAPLLSGNPALLEGVDHNAPAMVLTTIEPIADALKTRTFVDRFEVMNGEGELLYTSRGSLLEPPTVDSGTVRTVFETRKTHRGIVQDATKTFTATITVPLVREGQVVGAATLASNLNPPLEEFKVSTGSEIYLVDRNGALALGTDPQLWKIFDGKLSVRKSRLETRADGNRFYSVAVLPLNDGSGRVIGALVTVRDVTETQARQKLIRQVSIGAVIGFLSFVLFLFWIYLRRSFRPLDQAIAVLNALSRGDTSVTLDVKSGNDEIGRIASTVGVFRENAVKLRLLEARRERQRRRQELFIRLQMHKLAEMLEQEAREAIMADLRQIEEMGRTGAEGEAGAEAGGSGKGELDVLAVAFQTMSDRIREQHVRLEALIAERTRDVEVLREALRTRDQLNALRQELDFARELQLSSLPQVFPPFPERTEFDIHAAMVPAKEVGGDFYDFFLIDRTHLGFVIGDASGKGVPAAMFIAITRSLVKAVAPLAASPGECMAFVNTMLARDNPQTLFATCFYAVLDTASGVVEFCNAGHPPPLIRRKSGGVEAIRDVSGVALGVMEDLEYDTGTFRLERGDLLLLYTDGVTEATDSRDKLYEESRLIEEVEHRVLLEPAGAIASVQAAVEAFVGDAPQFDDITMLALRFLEPSALDAGYVEPVRRLMLTGFPAAPAEAEFDDLVLPTAAELDSPLAQVEPMEPMEDVLPVSDTLVEAAPATSPEPEPEPVAAPQKLVVRLGPPLSTPLAQCPRIRVPIANDLAELERLAGEVEAFVDEHGIESRIAFNLNLCLDELITNTVSYGYDDDQHHEIVVTFTLDGSTLITEIVDDGKPYDPFTQAPEPDLDLGVDDRPIGGLGVFLVKEFMDRVEYHRQDDKNVVILWKNTAEQES